MIKQFDHQHNQLLIRSRESTRKKKKDFIALTNHVKNSSQQKEAWQFIVRITQEGKKKEKWKENWKN